PSVVAHHDLDHGKAFLGPADEEIPADLGEADLNPRLPDEPVLLDTVVHVPERPGDRSLGLEAAPEEEADVTEADVRGHVELRLALPVLRVGGEIEQDAAAESQRRDRPVDFVPTD